jgi:diacylglycerol kinase family enzyme
VSAGVDVIVNRNAGRLRDGGTLRASILGVAGRVGARVHETSDLEQLESVARDLAARGSDAVVLAGGDGSIMAGLSALSRAWPAGVSLPPIAIAPAGTVCTIARNFGARGPLSLEAEAAVAAACRPESVSSRPTIRVRDREGGDRIGFIFGAGLVARFFESYYAASGQGLGAAAAIAARVFAGALTGSSTAARMLGPTACTVAIDGTTQSSRAWSLLLASVVRDVGLHFLATYRAGEDPERFHVVASGLGPRSLGLRMPWVIAGRPIGGEPGVDALARNLSVDFDAGDAAYVLDGDLFRARSVTVETGPLIALLRNGGR